ncbi:MAG: hypothetical protein ACSHWN_05875 [Methylophilaceae bacterium]
MKHLILFLVICLQFILAQPVLAAKPLGRLFSTPDEREQLDRLRELQKNQPVETIVEATFIESKPIALPDNINVQGYVKRSDGKDGTVWVNGEALQENSGNQDVQVGNFPNNSNAIPIRIPANGKRLSLKAGQVYDPENNRVRQSASYSISKSSGTIGDD